MTDYEEGSAMRRRVLAVLCLCLLVVVIDNTILNTALPTLSEQLRASTTDLQWITDAYTLTFAALLIPAGALGDRYGRRRALLLGLLVFAAGSAAAALSGDAATLVACRAAMGVGAAFVMPATLSILTAVFSGAERAGAISAWSAVAGLGIVIGPTLGGLLLMRFYWGSVFWINVPLVAVAMLATWLAVPDLPGERVRGSRLDLLGGLLSSASLVAIVDAVIEGPDRGWLSGRTTLEVTVGLVLLGGFGWRELTAANPLIDVRVFGHRAFSAATAAVGLTFFALFGSLFAMTQFLQLVHGYSPLSAGLRALPFAAAVLVTAPMSSGFVRRFGIRLVVPAGLLAMAAGLIWLSQATPVSSFLFISIGVLAMGVGMGLVVAPAGESIMSVLPAEQTGVGSAVNDTVQELGGSLGVALIGSVVSARYRHGIDTSSLPAELLHPARASISAANVTASHSGPAGAHLTTVAHSAFTAAMTTGFLVAGGTAAAGAVVIGLALPRYRPLASTPPTSSPDHGTTSAGVGFQTSPPSAAPQPGRQYSQPMK
jgi:EmrB/QacA subfamily drug resistance transporter